MRLTKTPEPLMFADFFNTPGRLMVSVEKRMS